MSKKIVYGFIVLLILLMAVYFMFSPSMRHSSKQLDDFALKDTSKISKIFMADKQGQSVLLERTPEQWTVNKKYKANFQPLQTLLETIASISVKTPVSKEKYETIIRQLAGKSVKVEIYTNSKTTPDKVYYVGHGNQDHTGSYMLMEESDVPFLVHIEGFRGYLTPRYFTDEKKWRSTALFVYDKNDIRSITLQSHHNPEESFRISLADGTYDVKDFQNNTLYFDTAKTLLYAARYKKVYFEYFISDTAKHLIDSVKFSPKEYTYAVEDMSGKTTTISTHKMKHKEPTESFNGELEEYNTDRMYGVVNDSYLVIVQYYVFDPLTVPVSYFLKRSF